MTTGLGLDKLFDCTGMWSTINTMSRILGFCIVIGGSRFFRFDMQNFRDVAVSGVHGPLYEVHAPLREILDPPLIVLHPRRRLNMEI